MDLPDPDAVPVKLGDSEYFVVPQPIGYLKNRLGTALGGLADLDMTADTILDVLGGRAYAVMSVFIPELMPEWEFFGYPTREAYEADDYNMEYDKSPTPRQVRRAFSVASQVNEFDIVKSLGKLIGPETIRAYVAGVLADSMTSNLESSSATSGGTLSMSSGTQAPTSVESTEDSLFPGSSD